jgi:hypothetical protein
MQVQFNKPVTIGAHTYGKGQHEVPAADVKDNWFFDALVKEGSAVVLRAEEGEAMGEVANDAPAAAEHSEEAPAAKAKGKTKAGAKAGAKETGDA